jgi:hypothetical protein
MTMKNWLITALAVMAMVLLVGCGGGGSTTSSAVTTPLSAGGTTALSMVPQQLVRLSLSGGLRPYTVTSSDATVVLASVSDSTLSLAAVKANATSVNVQLSDALKNKITLTVVVGSSAAAPFSMLPTTLTLAPGAIGTVSLQGGTPPFTVASSSATEVAAWVSGRTVSVNGLVAATGVTVKVVDSLGVTGTLPVTVVTPAAGAVALFTNVGTQEVLSTGSIRVFTVGGGTAPYVVSSGNPAAVRATLNGITLTLQGGVVGASAITLSDATGQQLTRNVGVQAGSPPLALSSTVLVGVVGSQQTVQIAGGRPPYAMYSDGSGVVVGSVTGSTMTLTIMTSGNGRATVYDADRSTVVASVVATGTATPTVLTLLPAKVTISENLSLDANGKAQQTSLMLSLYAAASPVQVFSSAPGLLKPTLSGNTVVVTTPGTASAPLPACVDADTTVTITVIDALGKSVTSDILIRNTGACGTT